MNTTCKFRWIGILSLLLVLPDAARAADPLVAYGLRHIPFEGSMLTVDEGPLVVTPAEEGDGMGVSIDLGEADCGVFVFLDTSGSLREEGHYLSSYAYGRVNGVPDQLICSLGASLISWADSLVELTADFSPIMGESPCVYELFRGTNLVAAATSWGGSIIMNTYGESAPRANPFWKLPDGSVAAEIRFSWPQSILLPGCDGEEGGCGYAEGDRILIRPQNASAVVDFASRVDVMAGGGETSIILTRERLGVFNHSHMALGDPLMDAGNGVLTISPRRPEDLSKEIGASIELDSGRQFSLTLEAQPLSADGASLMASAIGSYGQMGSDDSSSGGEFLGYAGIRNQGGALQAFGAFPSFAEQLQLCVLRNDDLVGKVLVPTLGATINLSGSPRVLGFDAVAGGEAARGGITIRLEQPTSFALPDGSVLEGDQIRFQPARATTINRLIAFNLVCSNLGPFTITGETEDGTLNLPDYFPEVTAAALLKKFNPADDGGGLGFICSSTRLNLEGQPVVRLTDQYPEQSVSATYSLGDDGLRFHGLAQGSLSLSSATGLRALPAQIAVGQSYLGVGNFQWHDAASEQDYAVEVSASIRVAALETIVVPAGSFAALRLETATTFTGGPTNAPTARFSTNWLAGEVGLVKFYERDIFAGGGARERAGDLAQFAILSPPMQDHLVNVGANILLQARVNSSAGAQVLWQKDGVPIPEAYGPQLRLSNVQFRAAGLYSVAVSLGQGGVQEASTTAPVATLRVMPFSDTPPFWVTRVGSAWGLNPCAAVADNADNTYIAGIVNGPLLIGTNTLAGITYMDIYLAKVTAAGEIAWAQRATGPYTDAGPSLGVDAQGNVYLAGTMATQAVLGPFSFSSPGLFMTKVDPTGTFLWATHAAAGSPAEIHSMAVDRAGNQYVVGRMATGTLLLGGIALTNNGRGYPLFLAKLDAGGQFLWAKQISTGSYFTRCAVILDGTNSLYLAGSAQGEATVGNLSVPRSPWWDTGFLVKTDTDGNFLWGKALGNNVRSLALDSASNLCILGEFNGVTSLDGLFLCSRYQYCDAFLAKVAPDGNLLWANLSPHAPGYVGPPLAVDSADNIYLAGNFYDHAAFNGTTFFMNGRDSTILTKLNSNGQLLWHKQLTGTSHNSPAVLVKGNTGNEAYLVGSFWQSLTLGESNLTALPPTNPNGFIVKITGATAPAIVQQPRSETVTLEEAVSFAVEVTGTEPFTYQWRKDRLDIPGATAASYTIAQAQWRDQGSYSVVVRNAGGIVASAAAGLLVLAPEAGTVAFGATQFTVIETNALALVNIERTGNTSLVATVEFQTAGGTATVGEDYTATAVAVQFAPGETLKTVAIPLLDDTAYEPAETVLFRLCNPGAGVSLGHPNTATLTITDDDPPEAPAILAQPLSRFAVVGGTVTFSVVAQGVPPLQYQWRKDGADLPGATDRILTLTGIQPGDAGIYLVVVRNPGGETPSAGATLTVAPLPVIVTQPQSQTVPYGEPVTFNVVATSGVPYATQIWDRAFSGNTDEFFDIPVTGSGTLYVHYDLRNDSDTLSVFSYDDDAGYSLFNASITTNGTGLLVVNYDERFRSVTIEVETQEGGGDGWSYRVEKVVSPLTYRWMKKSGGGSSYLVSSSSTLFFGFANFNQAGTYTVTVTDPVGSVTSEPFTLQVTGPLLIINSVPCPDGGNCCIQITWHVTDYHLEMCEDLGTDEWYDVPNASSGMIIPVAESNTMYRLRRTERVD